MKAEQTASLVKELEKIRSIRARNSYSGAWIGLILSILWLGNFFWLPVEKNPPSGVEWFPAVMFICALVLCLQSFFLIIRHLMNKKFAIVIEAMLEES